MTIEEAVARLSWEVDLLPLGLSNRPGTSIHPTHITIHNTDNAAAGADARAHGRYLRTADARARKVSWHFTVDDTRVIQHLTERELGWHAGPGNDRSIAIEVCQHAGIDQRAADDRAALLTAILMHQWRITLDNVVTHKHWTSKECPKLILASPGGFSAFKDAIVGYSASLGSSAPSVPSEDSLLESEVQLPLLQKQDGGIGRVQLLERLLGRAIADIEMLRVELEQARNSTYEGP